MSCRGQAARAARPLVLQYSTIFRLRAGSAGDVPGVESVGFAHVAQYVNLTNTIGR